MIYYANDIITYSEWKDILTFIDEDALVIK